MKIIYISNTRLPTEKAHGLATLKICEAFAELGYQVDALVPKLWRGKQQDAFTFYGIKNNFAIFKIFTVDLMPLRVPEKIAFLIQIFSFSLFSLPYVLFKYGKNFKNIVFFSHDYIPLYFITFISKNVFYDVHHYPGKNFMYKRLMEKSSAFGVQTKWKAHMLEKEWGISPEKIAYWPNGTDIEKFMLDISPSEARKKLNLSQDRKIVLYTGALFDWKGVDTLIRSVDFLDTDTDIYILGGAQNDVNRLRKNIPQATNPRVKFISFQPHNLIPFWQIAADVLVLPNTGKQKVSLYYTSPMKLFEYMASGTPIVASRIPSIEEVLNDKNAFLAEADNPSSFGGVIRGCLQDAEKTKKHTIQAQKDVKKYTWQNRARKLSAILVK